MNRAEGSDKISKDEEERCTVSLDRYAESQLKVDRLSAIPPELLYIIFGILPASDLVSVSHSVIKLSGRSDWQLESSLLRYSGILPVRR